jgi:hypothetical protein
LYAEKYRQSDLLFHADILHSYARIHETRVRRGVTTHRWALAVGEGESREQASTGAVEQNHRGETPSGRQLSTFETALKQLRYRTHTVSMTDMNKLLCRDKLLSTNCLLQGEKWSGSGADLSPTSSGKVANG